MKSASILALASTASGAVISLNARDDATHIQTRQAQNVQEGLNACTDKAIPCTIVSASTEKVNYGSKNPRDIADQFILPLTAMKKLWEKCLEGGCNVEGWDEDTEVVSGLGPTGDTLNVLAHGNWPPEFRHGLVWGMTELVGGLSEPYRMTADRPPVRGEGGKVGIDAFKAPKNFHISRYAWDDDHWESQAFISLSASMEDAGSSTCEALVGALETVIGAFNDNIGSLIGAAEPACGATG